MRVTLFNFRSHRGESVFEFPGSLNLLCGESGTGKSSVLMAIVFCLYGKRGAVTYEETTAWVRVELEECVVFRSAKPSRVSILLNSQEYLGDEAQAAINRTFGYMEHTSYYSQNAATCFFSLSPAEKMAVLEKLMYVEGKVEYKKKCSDKLKALQHKLSRTSGAIEALEKTTSAVVVVSDFKGAEAVEGARALAFLKNKQRLFESTQDKLAFLKSSLEGYVAQQYTAEQLEKHIHALTVHPQIQQYTAEECATSLREIDEDIATLQLAASLRASLKTSLSREELEKMPSSGRGQQCPSCGVYVVPDEKGVLGFSGESDIHIWNRLDQLVLPEESLAALQRERKLWLQMQPLFPHVLPLSLEAARKMLHFASSAPRELIQAQILQLEEQARRQNLVSCAREIKALEGQLFRANEYEFCMRRARELEELRAVRADLEDEARALETLKRMIQQAETEQLSKMILSLKEGINNCAAEVSEMRVEVGGDFAFEVYNRGRKCSFSMLSGGEQARLHICTLIAFSQVFGARFLILDECTSQLSDEEPVLKLLKSIDKKVILVAHGVVRGYFDHVYELGH
jgi:DNA repair exonuclease SbcCD ATPase subunit